ncbi:MAG: hypothetical protein HOP12_10870 [Candidatus Eisenbacteria bacterium]|uniref:Uncharacterized protein n=1 Tax=Eiseniibacteriota bacterium TaxID=2212470 RepID=A0A849SRJ6_UNCEI|nr:hypothetical protein [Candidatus Eisenbacteria bacterium]
MTALVGLAIADFKERSRRYSFLVTLIAMVWAAQVFLPPTGSDYLTLSIAGHRGLYNSAWVGAQLTFLANAFLGLIGFYLVKNSIERDRESGVGALLAATPLSRVRYVVAKGVSNLLVLASMIGVVAVSGAVLQLVRGEVRTLEPLALLAPLVLVTLPFMALVAATAVLFEALPVLRGGLGNVVWFFAWATIGVPGGPVSRLGQSRLGDPFGLSTLLPSMVDACRERFPEAHATLSNFSVGIQISDKARTIGVHSFDWNGPGWTLEVILARLSWFVIAFGVMALAAIPFDRFAEPRLARDGMRSWGRRLWFGRLDASAGAVPAFAPLDDAIAGGGVTAVARDSRTPAERLVAVPVRSGFDLAGLARAELTIAIKGVSRWWLLAALGIVIAGCFVPLPHGARIVSALAWIWPLLIWSPFGTREQRFGTSGVLFSVPQPVVRPLLATWLAGAVLALAISAPIGARLALAGDGAPFAAWLVGVTFVPAFALACGVLTGSTRLFEASYLMLWYAGPLNGVPALDFGGASVPAGAFGTAFGFAIATAGMLTVAMAARRRRLVG